MERICQNCTTTEYRILYKIDSEIVGIAMSPEIHTIHSWLFLLAYLTVEAHLP